MQATEGQGFHELVYILRLQRVQAHGLRSRSGEFGHGFATLAKCTITRLQTSTIDCPAHDTRNCKDTKHSSNRGFRGMSHYSVTLSLTDETDSHHHNPIACSLSPAAKTCHRHRHCHGRSHRRDHRHQTIINSSSSSSSSSSPASCHDHGLLLPPLSLYPGIGT